MKTKKNKKNKKNKNKFNTPTIENVVSFLNQGQLDKALTLCSDILRNKPNDINATNLTGIIKDKQGYKEDSIKYFKKASLLAPDNAEILTNIGITSFEINKLEEAKEYLGKAITINPTAVEAWFNLANIAYRESNFEEAINLYQKTLSLSPTHIKSYNNLANILQKNKDYKKAESFYLSALNISSNFIEALTGLTSLYFENKKFDKAQESAKKTLALQPDNLQILLLLGHIYIHENKYEQGKAVLEKALTLDKDNPAIHNLYGKLLENHDQKSLEALKHFNISFELDPTQARLAFDIGISNFKLTNFEEAKRWFEKSLTLDENNAETLNAMGVINQEFENYPAACSFYKQAIAINPHCASSHNNIGFLYTKLQNISAAEHHLLKAISLDPDSQSIQNNLSMLELLTENYQHGWEHYRFRNSVQQDIYEFPPENSPDSITNKNILVIREQGIGDELFFLRFIKQLKSNNANTSYLPCQKLLTILKPLELVDTLLKEMPDKNDYDMCVSVGDLPYLLGHDNVINTPPPLPLKVNKNAFNTVNSVLSEFGPPPYIGITWRAGGIINNSHTGSYFKEIDLTNLCNVFENIQGTIIAIQKNASHSELEFISSRIQRPVLDASIYHDDLEKMLALMDQLDIYIAVSNTNVHLREGLNKLSHVLVCAPPEWRWLSKGKKSPWFPSSLIYRQDINKNWQTTINELIEDLPKSPLGQ